MRTRAFLPLIAHSAACIAVGCVFLWRGASEVAVMGKFGPATPFHTTNRYLNFLVGDPAGSEHLLKALAALPDKELVAVIFRDADDSDTLLSYLVAYFAWPRPIKSLPINRDNAGSQMQSLRATPLSAAFFCGVKPPPHIQPIVRIGDGLAIARRPALKEGIP